MKDKFPKLEWVVILRHAKYDIKGFPVDSSVDFINEKIAPGFKRLFKTNSNNSQINTSLAVKGMMTGLHVSRNIGMVEILSIRELAGDMYRDGSLILKKIQEGLKQDTRFLIIVGHFEGVSGIANAIASSFDKNVECYVPDCLEGIIIDIFNEEIHKGVGKFLETV